MDESDIRDQVAQLEIRMEQLAESIARCGKIALGAKISIGAGAAWFALFVLWILPFNPTAFVAALTAILGGVVLLGSNATTWEQTQAELQTAEAMRASLIGRIALRVVGDEKPTLH